MFSLSLKDQNVLTSYNFFPIENFWFCFVQMSSGMDGLSFDTPLTYFLNFWGDKSRILIFIGGFDSLDIRAQQSFFSQNARLVKEYVWANFEKSPRGTLVDEIFWISYNFFPIENFWFFFTQISLGFDGLSFDVPFAYFWKVLRGLKSKIIFSWEFWLPRHPCTAGFLQPKCSPYQGVCLCKFWRKKSQGYPHWPKIWSPYNFFPIEFFWFFFLHRCLWVNELFRLLSLKVGLRPSKRAKLALKVSLYIW